MITKINYLLCVCAMTTLLAIGTIQNGMHYVDSLHSEIEALNNVIVQKQDGINYLQGQLVQVQNIVPSAAIKKTESSTELMAIFQKLISLDKGINHDYAKASIFYISEYSKYYDLDPIVVISMAYVESRVGTNILGDGDFGVMQINFKVWEEEMGLTMPDLFDLKNNVEIACQILSQYRDSHGDQYIKRYNGHGERARAYQNKVLKVYKKLRT